MIFVKELRPPIKMSGLSSFLVKTDKVSLEYKNLLNSLLITYPTSEAIYKNKLKGKAFPEEIEISCADLKKFLDAATILDDISLELVSDSLETNSNLTVTQEEIDNLNFKPFNHQIEAFNYNLNKKQWLLLDSMGLGKTLEIIGSAEILKSRGIIDHCLIICGVNAVKENWASEIAKFGNSSCMILGKKVSKNGRISYASTKECAEILKKPIEEFFVITNIEKLREDSIIKAINSSKNNFGMIAVDEIHRCASKNSSQGANLLKLTAPYLIGATGTLITNNPTSAYLPLAWTQNDHSILTTFRPIYEERQDNRIIGYKNLDILQEEIQACSLRRTLDKVRSDMPDKIIEYEKVEMNKDHWNFYWDIRNGVKEEADKVELNASNLLALTIRLRQAAVCPSILTTQPIRSSKIDRCVELVEEITSQGEKVVIMSNFIEPVKELAKELEKYNPLLFIGEISADEREKNKNLFQNDQNYKVIIGTHQAMGTGLTLNAAMYMIMLDTPFTYSSFAQSCDRIYRVNNTRSAYIKILEHSPTIDGRIHQILDTKKDLGDILVDGKDFRLTSSFRDELYQIIKEI